MSERQVKELQDLIVDKIAMVAGAISYVSTPQVDEVAANAINKLADALSKITSMEIK